MSLRIVALEHFRCPYQNAGSEVMMHHLMRALVDGGHEVSIITTHTPKAPVIETYDGITCHSIRNPQQTQQLLSKYKPHVIVSHHQNGSNAVAYARMHRAKSAFIVHNDFPHNLRVLRQRPDLVVFNTHWIAAKLMRMTRSHLVIHPPVFPEQHYTVPGDFITLINLNEHKGSILFYELARRLPDHKFLGVVGAHGKQIVRNDLTNVSIQEHTRDMRADVWSRTKVLLMPSVYESYGLTGLEAACSGIPTLANPTPGLQESLKEAGIFIGRDDIDGYVSTIQALYSDPAFYAERAAKALTRAHSLNSWSEVIEWSAAIESLVR